MAHLSDSVRFERSVKKQPLFALQTLYGKTRFTKVYILFL